MIASQKRERMEEPSFGEWLGRQIEVRGLGMREFAGRVGVGHAAARTWLKGFSVPEWHTCRGIADALNLTRDEVRERAGYLDPEDEPTVSEPSPEDERMTALLAIWPELSEVDQEGLLRTALALRDYGRRRR